MRILLIGEYSNVHATLAEGLRALGHSVKVVSDGDYWKDYPRDINLKRRSYGKIDTLRYLWDVKRTMHQLRDYDVVQLINPMFLELRAEHILPYYKQLRRQNGKVFLGAFGIDHFWVREGLKPDTFRYSDFYLNGTKRDYPFMRDMVRDWGQGPKGELNQLIADDCDGIITGLYEYDVCYRPYHSDKMRYIPFPINLEKVTPRQPHPEFPGVRVFIGIQQTRSEYKGTDIMLKALKRLHSKYPREMQLVIAENVPFNRYQNMMNGSDLLVDQLYSYTPGMNALLAMAKGIVAVGGGEEEYYQLQGEQTLRPVLNVLPSEQNVMDQIEQHILLDRDNLSRLSAESLQFVAKWHNHIEVAQQYVDFWKSR